MGTRKLVPASSRYVAFLRGVNVGGNGLVRMADLKREVEACGFANVRTYIQSGNVIFDAAGVSCPQLAAILEKRLSTVFKLDLRVVVLSHSHLKSILADVPSEWTSRTDLRCNIAFLRAPLTAGDVLKEIVPREGVDSVKVGREVVYLSTLLSDLTKTGFRKLLGTKAYKDLTIRNYSTARKVLGLMEE